jgi:hypothetical protein
MTNEEDLTREDWQYIHFAMQDRFNKARPTPAEGRPSPAFLAQERRIMTYLLHKAFKSE